MGKPKQEPWFKPRADEDADEELINWLGGGGGGKKPPAKQGGWGCPFVAGPVVAVVIGLVLLLVG